MSFTIAEQNGYFIQKNGKLDFEFFLTRNQLTALIVPLAVTQ